jgi:hypothetical protein
MFFSFGPLAFSAVLNLLAGRRRGDFVKGLAAGASDGDHRVG